MNDPVLLLKWATSQLSKQPLTVSELFLVPVRILRELSTDKNTSTDKYMIATDKLKSISSALIERLREGLNKEFLALNQDRIFQEVVEELSMKDEKYKYGLVKWIVEVLEDGGDGYNEIHVGFLNVLAGVYGTTASPVETNRHVLRFYECLEDKLEYLFNLDVISPANQVGLTFWEASIHILKYLNHELVDGKSILELGAGTGISTLYMASKFKPKSVLATDYDVEVLKLLSSNIKNSKFENLQVRRLDWEDHSSLHQLASEVDIILAADCVYDINVIPHFVETLEYLLQSPKQIAIVSSTKRNEVTMQAFLTFLHKTSLEITELKSPLSDDFDDLNTFIPVSSVMLCHYPQYRDIRTVQIKRVA